MLSVFRPLFPSKGSKTDHTSWQSGCGNLGTSPGYLTLGSSAGSGWDPNHPHLPLQKLGCSRMSTRTEPGTVGGKCRKELRYAATRQAAECSDQPAMVKNEQAGRPLNISCRWALVKGPVVEKRYSIISRLTHPLSKPKSPNCFSLAS